MTGFTRAERMAYWINGYNAYTVKLILEHYPVDSIKDIGGIFKSAFKIEFITSRVRAATISLNTIEHEILRPEFEDPRVHAAIVCASTSCPVLRAEAFRADRLDAQLDAAMRGFINDPVRNRWDPASRTLHLSSIFKWFRADFESTDGTALAFAGRFFDAEIAAQLQNGAQPSVEYLKYDWSLNGE